MKDVWVKAVVTYFLSYYVVAILEEAKTICKIVFLKLWPAAVPQVVRGAPQSVSGEKALQKLYHSITSEKYTHK